MDIYKSQQRIGIDFSSFNQPNLNYKEWSDKWNNQHIGLSYKIKECFRGIPYFTCNQGMHTFIKQAVQNPDRAMH